MDKKNPNKRTPKKKQSVKGRSSQKRNILNGIIIVFLTLVLVGGVSGFFMLSKIVGSTDTNDLTSKLVNKVPSVFYASDGKTKIGELGGVSRENVEYNQIPQSTIDAFLAIEDSRYFSHNGFDLPRFLSSALFNVKSGSFAQGGSTLTMQTIDNFIMKPEEEEAENNGKKYSALEKVERKIQEIYLSMTVEKELSKEEIMTKYLNEINFGESARGIQKGAEYYFGKNVQELNLAESAFLAGVINAPNTYNPYRGYDKEKGYNFYEYATDRRDETLQLMLKHGYITETEYKLAKATQLAFQLTGESKTSTNGTPEKYYRYVEQAAAEVRTLTGEDPALVPMKIYTSLDVNAQDHATELSNGETITFPDDTNYQLGFTVLNNSTGEIIAVSAGRGDVESNIARFKEEKNPGSTIKPVLDYALTFDKLGYATSRMYIDQETKIDGRAIQNADGKYHGKVSMDYAIAKSLNTPAIQSLDALVQSEGQAAIIAYMKSIGFSEEVAEAFNMQYSIGGSEMKASPTQMAAAYATFANGGYYIEPHMVRKVEYIDGSKTLENKPKKTRVMSEQAAYMMSELLYSAVNGKNKGENLMGSLGFGSYPVYGKTGTSDWATEGLAYGIPEGAMKDEWMINYTSEYTIATWTGFDKSMAGSYITTELLYRNIPGLINKSMLDTITTDGVMRIQNPGGISSYGGGLIKSEWLSSAAKNNPMTEQNTSTSNSSLKSTISSAAKMNSSDYTTESYAKLKEALDAANKVLSNANATQEEIDAAKTALEEAMQGLVKKEEEKPKTDSAALTSVLQNANNYLDTSKYNALQVSALQTQINSANLVLANSNATQSELDAAAASVQSTIDACIANPVQATPAPTPSPSPTPDPTTPEEGNGTTPETNTGQ